MTTDRMHAGPHKGRFPCTIDICDTCAGFLAYGTTGDYAVHLDSRTPGQLKADTAHAYRMYMHLGVPLSHVSEGCRMECPDHGISAYEGDEEAYETAKETRDTETWHSSSSCDGCGALAGLRQHATMWVR
jgi:hypothetical protein